MEGFYEHGQTGLSNSEINFVEDKIGSPYDMGLKKIFSTMETNGCGYTQDNKQSFLRFLDEKKTPSSAKYGSQFSETFGKFYSQSKYGSNDTNETSRKSGVAHENCITSVVPLKKAGETTVTSFSTSGLDGKIVIWDLQNEHDLSDYV